MVLRRRPRPQGGVWGRLLAVAAYPLCHRLNGGVVIGLALLAVVTQSAPVQLNNIKIPDILEDALWQGCRAEGFRRLRAHIIGKGWQVP